MGGRARLLVAVAVVAVLPPPQAHARGGGDEGAIVGTVFVDSASRDGIYTAANDLELSGYRVELLRTGAANAVVASQSSNSDGQFAFSPIDMGNYRLRVSSPAGVWLAETGPFAVAPGQTAQQNARIDPTGRIYDSTTGAPIAGVHVTLRYDDDGARVPDTDLAPGQQGQVTSGDGIYRFDPLPGRRYRISVDTTEIGYAAPSTLIPPRAGFAPTGPVVPDPLPQLDGGDTTYYLGLDVADDAYEVVNNHVPVDPIAPRILLAKRADRPSAAVGDIVGYTVTASNMSARTLTEVYLLDAPARGLTYLPGQARATVNDEAVAVGERADDPRSRSSIRFGPFELPAGGKLTLGYHVVVSADTRPGTYTNRVILIDGAGAELSSAAEATIRVGSDAVFDEALVVGRVYCDDDGDGEQDGAEPGLMGARVFIETGSYAVTDSAGLYHLSQIAPGSHMIKLDEASLAGGSPTTDVSRVLYLTRALPVRVDFGVACSREVVTARHRRATVKRAGESIPDAPPPPKTGDATVTGSVASMTAAVDGVAIALPQARVAAHADRFELAVVSPTGTAPAEWVLGINRHERDGVLAEPMIRTWQGVGAPPTRIAWDGKDAGGDPLGPGLYSAQLAVRSNAEGMLAISARAPFAVQPDVRASAPIAEEWRGSLFSGPARAPAATADLKRRVAALAQRMRPGDTVEVEVHGDGTGMKLKALADTQRQAELIQKMLADAGVNASSISSRGRGNLDQVASPSTREGKQRNRRVVVAVTPGAQAEAPIDVPGRILDVAAAKVNGKPVDVGADGRFETVARIPICVELLAADGRLATACASTAATTKRPPSPTGRRIAIAGDLATGTLSVAGAPVAHDLLRADAKLTASAGGELELQLTGPGELEPAAWSLAIRTDAGEEVHRTGADGAAPPAVSWDGSQTLQPGRLYWYDLTVTTADGSSATSAPRSFLFDPPPVREDVPELANSGRLFRSSGRLGTKLKSHLSLVASALEATERYYISVRVSTRAFRSGADRDEPLAARRKAVADYLGRLGVSAERYELDVQPGAEARDEIYVALARPASADDPPPPEATPAITINGVPQPLDGLAVAAELTVQESEPLVIEVAMPSGQTARFVTDLPPAPEPAPAPPPPPPMSARAADLSVILPRESARLGAPRVPVHGKTDPTNYVTVNGERAHVRADGRFDVIATLPPGKQTLKIVSVDTAGNSAEIAWPLDIAQSDVFIMAMGEGIAASARTDGGDWSADDAWLDGMTDETTVTVGPLRLHGRAAAYVKARLRNFSVTARVDTAAVGDDQPFFEQLVDPGRDYAVFGDSAREVRDAEARGKVYLHVDDGAGKSATLGNIRQRLRGGDLLRFDRVFYGAAIQLDGAELTKDHEIDATAFSAFEETGLSRDINLFRSTGGSLYYLRNGHVVEGSEQVRVVVRDRDTDLILTERVAIRDVDYVVDYPAGRILFTEPPASVADTGWMLDNLGASTTPLDGHPVFVEVQYEHRGGGVGGAPTGAYVRDTMYGHLSLGVGVVGESRGSGDYALWGADATYRIDDRSRVRVEVGASRNTDAENFLSLDGGMTFDRFGAATADYSWGWKVGADIGFTDATSASVHAQSLERGFSSGTTALEQGHTKFGGQLAHRLNDTDRIAARLEGDVAELDDRTHMRTGLQWRRAVDDWTFTVEGGHEYLHDIVSLDASRAGVGGIVARKLSDQLTVRAGQEVQTAIGDDDPLLADEFSNGVTSSVGADLRVAPGVLLTADEYLRWNGDHATRVGLRTRVGDAGSMYVREQLGTRDGDFVSTTIVGASDRFGAAGGGRTYGEYQLENGALGQRNRAVLGLGHRWEVSRGLRLGLGFEHQQVFGGFTPDGMPVGDYLRDVVHSQLDFVRLDRLKAGGRVELRWDDSETDERWQVVAGVGADVKATRDLTVFGRARILHTEDLSNQKLPLQTENEPDTFTAADHAEVIAGWTYRPPRASWLDLFSQYAYQVEQRPATEAGTVPEARSHVASLAPVATLPLRFELSTKLAWKRTELTTPVGSAGDIVTDTDALLWLARLAYRIYGRWEVAGEYRRLQLWRADDAEEVRTGALFEAAYTVVRRVRLGVGYNLSRFSDNELGDLERDTHGLFVRVIGTY